MRFRSPDRLRLAATALVLGAILMGACTTSPDPLSLGLTSGASESLGHVEGEFINVTPKETEPPPTHETPTPAPKDTVCVDGGLSGRQFADLNCLRIVETLSEALEDVRPGSLIVVRAFPSNDKNSIRGMGTYRDLGLQNKVLIATASNPIIIQAEGFDPEGDFTKPIVDGGVRIHGSWQRTPATDYTLQIPFDRIWPGYPHWACIDRIWVSRLSGKTELADFPLTRPIPNQGSSYPEFEDCRDNTHGGRSITPADVDGFPGSYLWLDETLYVHLPGGEDPNDHTVEVPRGHPFSSYESAAGLTIRGFRVYHSLNGIDLFSCGTEAEDRCEASHNNASFNHPYGLQSGPYSYLHHNSGLLNTIQLIKITGDYSEIAYNEVGPQLSHGFKLNGVRGCVVHHNEVYGNRLQVPETGSQSGWSIIGTRDLKGGIYLKNGTEGCSLHENLVYDNTYGFYIRNDGDNVTQGNAIERNTILQNETAMRWRETLTWESNSSNYNVFSWSANFHWGDQVGSLAAYATATGLDKDSEMLMTSPPGG